MTYAVLGTLYNRYVLQLRGVDQIPQFSIESMRYHGGEAWDWIKDIISGLNIGGHESGGIPYRGRSSGLPSGGPRTPNPVSHHSQNSGTGPSGSVDDLEVNGGLNKSGNSGFIRPQQNKSRGSPFQRQGINPVSHQSQAFVESLSFSASPPPSQPQHHHDLSPQGHQLSTDSRGSTKEEGAFIPGNDEDAEELVDVSMPVAHTPTTPRPSESSSSADITASSTDVASAARGRDLGGGDHIRL
jgi:cation-dependent mannose-6-phosphate receptor